ncbi:MAG: hypothetical protein JNK21_00870 [Rhodospirillaceae bacterium]|nr:hypothetical protein [Rhodospirillaceae bacterium]
MRMRNVALASVAGLAALAGMAEARDFAFFNILKDGKADKEAIGKHCGEADGWVRAFTAASLNLTQKEAGQRVVYKDKQFTNVNANPGEWSTAVYKALCPGLYTFTLDYTAAPKDGTTNSDVAVQMYVWRKTGSTPRPGDLIAVADKAGKGRGTGHASATITMNTGDELSTFGVSADGKSRFFERIQLNGYRVHHMPQLAADFDSVWWEADRAEADKMKTLPPAAAK